MRTSAALLFSFLALSACGPRPGYVHPPSCAEGHANCSALPDAALMSMAKNMLQGRGGKIEKLEQKDGGACGIWASPQGRFAYVYAKDGTFDAAKLGTPPAERILACRL